MDVFRPRQRLESSSSGDAPQSSPALERLVRRSLFALRFERVWRIAASLLTLLGFFLAVSWAGLWLELGPWGRILGVAAFGAAALWALARAIAAGAPSRAEALARLDAAPGAEHRLASSLEDTLAGERHDPATRMLWTLHRRRLESKLRAVEVAPPAPRVAERDPFALRALALVAALAAAFAAGPDRQKRLQTAFDWGGLGSSSVDARVDAWLDPPAYTGRPPIVLSQRNAPSDAPSAVAAPINSSLIVHAFGEHAPPMQTSGGLAPLDHPPQRRSAQEHEEKFKLTGDARLVLRGAAGAPAYDLVVIPDRPPIIEPTQEPRNNARGSMTLSYRTDDDYGVASAEAIMARPLIGGRPTGRALYPPPRLPLALPASRAGLGEARATLDLADHPWAGAKVVMNLVARDEGGNEAVSAPIEVLLPQRRFTQPLARALAEQRRNLVLEPDRAGRVFTALDALSLGAGLFQIPSSTFLGLETAKNRLDGARGDDDLREVVELLWAMALSLEGGDLSQAERDLRAAQQELRDALARGASEEEIARLTEDLRNAMDKFLRGLTQRQGELAKRPTERDGAQGALTEQDLQSMLDEIEKAQKAGDLAQAQRLLDELQDILENLRPSRAARADPRAREMSRALDEIDRLTREQQQLRDDTSRGQGNGAEPRRGRGASGDDDNAKEMRSRQQALREKLEQQQKRLGGMGEETLQDFQDADKAMKEAEKALGQNGEGRSRAVDAQGRALQALRRGADQLASRMQGGEDGEDGEEGQSGRPGRRPGMGQGERDDPLGRPTGRGRQPSVGARYDPLGLPPAVRARRVQEELRRRLGQPERPAEELDYLERLLRR